MQKGSPGKVLLRDEHGNIGPSLINALEAVKRSPAGVFIFS
jgi:hypothetical protein